MATRSAILHKKLHELESELTDLFHLPLHPTAAGPCHEISFDDIKHRFRFLNTLLSAEVASQPHDFDQLHEIGQRLTALKADFRDWNASRLTDCSASSTNLDDTLSSICSDCSQTLLNDDVRGQSKSGEDSPYDQFFDCVDRKDDDDRDVKDENVIKRKLWGRIVKYSGLFGLGMIVGAISMVELFNSFDNFVQCDVNFLYPT